MPLATAAAGRRQVSVALSRGATILSRRVTLDGRQAASLSGVLDHLTRLGLVACYTVAEDQESTSTSGFMEALHPHVGREVLEAVAAAGAPPPEEAPAFLCSVWPFQERDGQLSAAAQLLGLDMIFEAWPSDDDEAGFYLAGGNAPLLARARAQCSAPLGA